MATSKKFSELPVASSMNNGDLFAVAQEDAQAETGYTSKSATALVVGKKLNGEIEYATDLPSFPPGDQNPLDALEYLNSKINDLYPVDSASGSLVNFTTSLALPLVALKTNIVAQGGGGTPSAPVAITGFSEVNLTRAGKNLLAKSIVYYTSSINALENCFFIKKGTYTLNLGTVNNATNWRFTILLKDGNGTDLSGDEYKPATGFSFATNRWRWGSNTTDKTVIINIAKDCFIRFCLELGDTSADTTTSNSQLEAGSTATAYEAPVTPTIFTLPLGQTIYGGHVDWSEGKLVVTWARYTNLATNISSIAKDSSSWRVYYSSEFYGLDNQNKEGLCDKLTFRTSYSGVNNNNYSISFPSSSGNQVLLRNDDLSTSSDVQTFLATLYTVYPLATPIEISLPTTMPSTIEGVQNWFADSGDIELEYKMSVQEYIDKKIAEVQALIL